MFPQPQPQPSLHLRPAIFTNATLPAAPQPTAIMSHAHHGIGAMPGPSSSKVPSFNDEVSELLEFFEFFEDLASTYGLTDADKCKAMKNQGQRYTVCDLEWIVVNQADNNICTETELIQYYHQFHIIAVWLVTNEKISILQHLELRDLNFNSNEPADFEKVLAAGHHVFLDEVFDTEFNDPITLCIKSI
ncbi:hypothetical protein K503DRAFT_804724 [Rhizopogon vinicolor AM-OR11-026]|uniref:Uncharacterized protein n=1 Tax=Rhizopogon vinicolor AM-OR11-026 TaxID=1314800 RepID=A0A1B7MK88_9AGAM|nr:hypothetical protein K503DRAFT_804724 [Rhizopogon vinicolor AM-OR11-026]